MKKIVRSLAALSLGWLIGSCGGGDSTGPPPPPPTVATVDVAAMSGILVPTATAQLIAIARDAGGNQLARVFAWSSADASKATVSSAGVVTGVGPGTTTITASVDGKSGSVAVTVLDGGVVSSTGSTVSAASGVVQLVVPADAVAASTSLSVAASSSVTNDPRVVKGAAFDFGPTGTTFAKPIVLKIKYDPANLPQGTAEAALQIHLSTSNGWQVVAGSVADVTAKVVTAQISHFSTYAILIPEAVAAVGISGPPDKPIVNGATALVAGSTLQLSAALTAVDGSPLSNRVITWTSSDPTTASVSASGLVTAIKPGLANISAASEGKSSSVAVTVTPIPVASVTLNPTAASIVAGANQQITASLRDASNTELTDRVVTWTSSEPSVATVSTTGLVTGVAPGATTITATSEGKSATAAVTVTPVPISTVTVALAASTVESGQTTQATATALDASHNALSGRVFTWSSDNTAVATVIASTGLVTAVSAGSANIAATSEGKSGSAPVTVTPIPVASVTVTPPSASLTPGNTQQLTAATKDQGNNVLTGRTVTWQSDHPEFATVSSTGLVTAVAVGSATITATSEGKSGSSLITVTPTPVASIDVSLNPATITAVGTSQASAITRDAGGNVLTGRSMTWTSDNASVATVNAATGAIAGVSVGTATITALSEGKTGVATITVTQAAVATVTASLASSSIVAGTTTQASAVLKDSQGRVLTGRTVNWTSDNTAVATVSATTGLVTAVSAGAATITATSETKNGSAPITVTSVPVASVTVTPSTASIVQGGTQQLSAETRDANNNVLTGRTVTWQSDHPEFASVSTSSGLVTAVAIGSATITATSEGKTGTSAVTVTPVPVALVAVSLNPATITAVGTSQAAAITRDANNNVLSGRIVTWTSDNTAVATVNATTGAISSISVGTANITALSEGKTGSAPLTVTQAPVANVTASLASSSIVAGTTTQASAVLKDSQNRVLSGRTIAWSSDNTGVATVNTTTGLVTAVAAGTAHITATSEGVNGSTTITVTPVPVASVSVSLAASSVQAGQTTQATAVTRDASNNVLTGRSIVWTSDKPLIATVNSTTGLVTAFAPGTAKITATSEGVSGSADVTVTPVPVATVTVSPNPVSIFVGAAQQLTAVTKDAGGNILNGRAVTWGSDNTAAATVDVNGLVTAHAAGSATITATSEGKSGTSSVTVSNVPVATVTVTPPSATLQQGSTQQLSAETRDAGNNLLTGRSVAWSSDHPGFASVSSSGLVTAVAPGSATITATSEGKSGTSTITVVPIPVASVDVSLNPASITAVGTSQAAATTRDAGGNVLTGRSVTWSSDNTTVATVNAATGAITGVSVGTANIKATSEGKTGSALLTVTQAPVATVNVTLAAASISAVETTQGSVVLKDSQGRVLTGRTVTWSSNNPSVATVNMSTGLVTGVSAGSANITATSEGQTGSASITVTSAPVATVSVSLASSSITAVETTQATATLKDSQGRTITGRTVVWASDNTAVATVNATTGVVAGVSVGTANITATSEGKTGSAPLTVTQAPVATVAVTLAATSISAVETTQGSAVLKDSQGRVLTGRTVTWSSDNAAVATVNATTGLVTAVAAGTANITATSEGKTGSAQITVTQAPVATISVVLANSSITAVETTQATATVKDSQGRTLTGRTVAWSSDNAAIATVDATTGLVTAVATGTANITASSEGKTGSAQVTVTPAPVAIVTVSLALSSIEVNQTTQATATTLDSKGRTLTGRTVTWSSDNTAVATVNSATGLVTAVSAGSANIIATSEGKSGSAPLTVTPIPVASVTVSLNPTTITAVGTSQATATTLDSHGGVLTGRAIAWNSDNNAVASVNATTGAITGVSVGTANITATSEGKSGSALLTVTQAPVATVDVTLTATSISAVETTQASAVLKDSQGRTLTSRTVVWSSDNPAAATVDATTGVVTAVAPGSANIIATSETKTGSAALTVTAAPVATVTVALSANSIDAVGTSQATATTLDAHGQILTGRSVTWSSDNTAVATVDAATGLVTAESVGTANIIATSETKTGSAQITVTQAPVATVTVSLATTSINAVQQTQATAVLHDSKGRVLTGRTIAWSSDNNAAATVDAGTGLVTAVATGTAHIVATSETKTGSATLTVTPAPVASVTVSPSAPSIVAGNTEQLSATLKDAKGRDLTGRTVDWSSNNQAVATVNASTGLVSAITAGTATITALSEGQSGTSFVTVTAPTSTTSLLHHSTRNPRYFENATGQIVYLTGSHTWSNLRDNGTVDPPPTFNYTAYLDFLTAHNHNFFRMWAWEQDKWTAEIASDYWFSPGPYQRNGPGTALDGKPKFDLSQFNQSYFDRLRQRVIDAGARGIYVSVMLFDGWSVGTKGEFNLNNPWQGHPFNAANNINGIDGDANSDGNGFESQTLTNPDVTALQEAYVHKVIDAVGDLDNVLYEIDNEGDPSSKDWQYHMIQVIRDYEATKPKQHPVGITPMWPNGSDADLTASGADWISLSDQSGTLNSPPTATGSKVVISDTDHICGICGTVDWVWKSFAKGQNPILMDGYDGAAIGLGAENYNASDPVWEQIRTSLGQARSYALRLDLAAAVPHGDVVLSEVTGYCLAKPGSQYLVYIPGGGSVTLDLSAVSGTLNVEWFNPTTGATTPSGTTSGGSSVTLTPPFSGPAVLFLH